MLRPETRARARALQLLYMWDMRGRPPVESLTSALSLTLGRWSDQLDMAETLAAGVARDAAQLDAIIAAAADNWRFERIGAIERNILRLALHEMDSRDTPIPVVIDEAVKLAHWFAGPKAPGFVNGVLDAVARKQGYL